MMSLLQAYQIRCLQIMPPNQNHYLHLIVIALCFRKPLSQNAKKKDIEQPQFSSPKLNKKTTNTKIQSYGLDVELDDYPLIFPHSMSPAINQTSSIIPTAASLTSNPPSSIVPAATSLHINQPISPVPATPMPALQLPSFISPLPVSPVILPTNNVELDLHPLGSPISSVSANTTINDEECIQYTAEPVAQIINTKQNIVRPSVPVITLKPSSTQVPEIDELDLQLQQMSLNQNTRILLNVGGVKFEITCETLSADPKSLLARMVSRGSPFKPYKVGEVYCYFIDRDPQHFRVIINFLRSIGGKYPSSRFLPNNSIILEEILCEAAFYRLDGLKRLIHNKLNEY
ncbi:hypothetical protein SNE40_008474 [Patella caerulea]|uniref:BTB domain-containing protein n=1 Tax=Patella caerulea TaxID=87958 RepID=A0AAN8JYX5_PATCE